MTDIDYASIEQRVAELPDRFSAAAVWAANRLEHDGHAYVCLEPGDATSYRVMIIAPSDEMWSGTGPSPDRRYYHVALSMGLGLGYDWPGYETDPRYVVEKWTRNLSGSDYHTACVLTRFLNTLAPLIGGTS